MQGKHLGLVYGFMDNITNAVEKAETHPNACWELAEGTVFAFDVFDKSDESTASVVATLKRVGEKINWSININKHDRQGEH